MCTNVFVPSAMPTRLEIQHDAQGRVNAAHLFATEITHALTEPTGVHRCRLFSQHPRDAATDLDLRSKACGPG